MVLVQHYARPCWLVSHLLVINHFRLKALIYHMSLVLVLSKRLVRAHRYVLFLFGGARWLIITTHGPASLSRHFLLLSKWPSNRIGIAIVNHWLCMRLRWDAELVLVSWVSSVLGDYWFLIVGDRTHEIVVLRDYPLVLRRLSLLLGELGLWLVGALGLHVLTDYLVLRELLLRDVLGLVPVESTVVRVKTHAHVVEWDLRLVKDFIIVTAW